MEGLLVKSIPQVLLARILVQLYIIPQPLIHSPQFDLISVVLAGLSTYGATKDLDGFLTFCAQRSLQSLDTSTRLLPTQWQWCDRPLDRPSDWDIVDHLQEQQPGMDPVGLRLQVNAETVRPKIELTRFGKKLSLLHNEQFATKYEGQHISIEVMLNKSLQYLNNLPQTSSACNENMIKAIQHRLQHFESDRKEYEDKHALQSDSDFVLMGALMVKHDAVGSDGFVENAWYMYLRDYMDDPCGSIWRVLKGTTENGDTKEIRISSYQVLSDLRGTDVTSAQGIACHPSPTSYDYRPVYLFYCNNDVVSRSAQETLIANNNSSFSTPNERDEHASSHPSDYEYVIEDEAEEGEEDDALAAELCKYCGIAESIDNINTIFFCDECDLPVHQLCEQPPIASFEMEIEPWFCRDCCARKGLPLPTPPSYIASSSTSTHFNTEVEAKRRKLNE